MSDSVSDSVSDWVIESMSESRTSELSSSSATHRDLIPTEMVSHLASARVSGTGKHCGLGQKMNEKQDDEGLTR